MKFLILIICLVAVTFQDTAVSVRVYERHLSFDCSDEPVTSWIYWFVNDGDESCEEQIANEAGNYNNETGCDSTYW
jgi:hypothetical protein